MTFAYFLRPKITDLASAKRVSQWGLWALFILLLGQVITVVTGGNTSFGIIVPIVLVAIGIYYHSRVAIVILLFFEALSLMLLFPFIVGIMDAATDLRLSILFSACITLLQLHLTIQASNAIFAYHRLNRVVKN